MLVNEWPIKPSCSNWLALLYYYSTFFLEGHKKENALLFYTRTRFPFRCTNQAIIKSRYLFRYSLKGVTNIRRHDVLRMLVTYLYPYHEYITIRTCKNRMYHVAMHAFPLKSMRVPWRHAGSWSAEHPRHGPSFSFSNYIHMHMYVLYHTRRYLVTYVTDIIPTFFLESLCSTYIDTSITLTRD